MSEPIGIPVIREKHPGLFNRKWPEPYREPGTDAFPRKPPAPAPSVMCREVTDEPIPDAASKAAERARAAGYDVRVTYACGPPRGVGPTKGRCVCGALVRIYKEAQTMFPHVVPDSEVKEPCPSTEMVWQGGGTCKKCGKVVKALKKGGISKHYIITPARQCEHSYQSPHELVPGEEVKGIESFAVRVDGVGTGVWMDGDFEFATLRSGTHWRMVGADEFQLAVQIPIANH